jgi:hypothetical protein
VALLLETASQRALRGLCGLACLLILWNLLLICQYRYGLVPADGGADPATLLANVVRLVQRKRVLLVGQALAGPVLLGLLAFWPGGRKMKSDKQSLCHQTVA